MSATACPFESPADEPQKKDAFDVYLETVAAEGEGDPYPIYAHHRAEQPVFQGSFADALRALTGVRRLGRRANDKFVVFRAEAVQTVLRNREMFSSQCMGQLLPEVFGRTLVAMDDPDHHAYRSLVGQAFSPRTLKRWEDTLVGPAIDSLIDAFADDGRADLVRQLTFPFPIQVIGVILGLPPEDWPTFHELAVEIFNIVGDWNRGVAAARQFGEFLAGLVAERRGTDGEDLITVLSRAECDGRRLTDEEIVDFCRLLIPAGAETTFRAANSLFLALLTHREQLDAVRADESLIPAAVEEALRWEPPFTTVMRTALRDVEVSGTVIPAGSLVFASIGSANHDEEQWPDADAFDIHRSRAQHLAFGSGPHMCLGLHLGRMELRLLLSKVLTRLPALALDPSLPVPSVVGTFGRSPTSLNVVF